MYPTAEVSIPQGPINTPTEFASLLKHFVSIPQGPINTHEELQGYARKVVSIPQGPINTIPPV